MKKFDLKFIAETAIIAALYVALTWAFLPISYGGVQFRISELLMLLVLLNRKYSIPLIIGCLIANTTSPLGWPDIVFGTLATALAILPMLKIKNLYVGALMPVVSNALIVSIELGYVFDMFNPAAFFFNVFTIALGEAVVLYLIGIPFVMLLKNNQYVCEVMQLDMSHVKTTNYFNFSRVLAIALAVIGVVFYVAYPVYLNPEDASNISLLMVTKDNWYLVVMAIIPVLYLITYLVTDSKIRHIVAIVLGALLFIPYITLLVQNSQNLSLYAYFYPIYFILLMIIPIFEFKKETETI